MTRVFWRTIYVRTLPVLLALLPVDALGAELWLRESLLQAYRGKILVTVQATIDQLGKKAHPLAEDCDLHVPLRSDAIRLPLLGELKNACSMRPANSTDRYWSQRIEAEVGAEPLEVQGVFRIWPEHPPEEGERQCECDPLPDYPHSNPDHMVELHPVTRIGPLDFSEHVREIRKGNQRYRGSQTSRLKAALGGKTITIEREEENGERYIVIQGPKTGYNHWTLNAIVRSPPRPVADGHSFSVDVVYRRRIVKADLPVVTVRGTKADRWVKDQHPAVGQEVTLFGIVRLEVDAILDAVGDEPKVISMPYELVILDIASP